MSTVVSQSWVWVVVPVTEVQEVGQGPSLVEASPGLTGSMFKLSYPYAFTWTCPDGSWAPESGVQSLARVIHIKLAGCSSHRTRGIKIPKEVRRDRQKERDLQRQP